MKNTRFAVQYRRSREGRTNYKRRAKFLIGGKPRAIIRRTLRRMIVQIASPSEKGDIIIASADSSALKKHNWNHGVNIPTAYLTGYLAGVRASKKIKEAIVDIGDHTNAKGGRIYAAVKGLIDGGLNVSHDPEIFPSEERLSGKHIRKNPNITEEMQSVKSKLKEDK